MFFLQLSLAVLIVCAVIVFSIPILRQGFIDLFCMSPTQDTDEDWKLGGCGGRLLYQQNEHQEALTRKKLAQDREALELEMDLAQEECLKNIRRAAASQQKERHIINPSSDDGNSRQQIKRLH